MLYNNLINILKNLLIIIIFIFVIPFSFFSKAQAGKILNCSNCGNDNKVDTKPKLLKEKEKNIDDNKKNSNKKNSKTELLNQMPEWCLNPKISIVAIQVCGIASYDDIIASRSASELEGRTQLARRFDSLIKEACKEETSEENQKLVCKKQSDTKFRVERATVLKRKTVVIDNKYTTFSLIVYPL